MMIGATQPTIFLGEEGCLFPEESCMPGMHYTGQCHTADMLEEQEAEHRIPEAVAYLTSSYAIEIE
jgi:hypothetical protein